MSRVRLQKVALGTFNSPSGPVNVYITREWLKLFDSLSTSDITGLEAALETRASASHSHLSVDITDLEEATQDTIGAMVVAAGGTYDDVNGTITFPAETSQDDLSPWSAVASRIDVLEKQVRGLLQGAESWQ